MKKILVPCDFSQSALSAYRFALDIAKAAKGEVHLVHVIELPVMHDTVLMPTLSFEEALLKELREKSAKDFESLTKKYPHDHIKVKSEVVFGDTYRLILDSIEKHNIDLVIMGTKGATGIKELFVGSNTEKIVRHSPVPVLAIRKDPRMDAIKNIVFPNTLDVETQEGLVQRVKALQEFFNATLHIVWINTPTNFTSDTITRIRLEDFVKRFMIKNYTINIYNDTYEEDGILNFARLIKADLIAMGTHGRKGLAHVLNGSITEDIVNHVDAPIWTYSIK